MEEFAKWVAANWFPLGTLFFTALALRETRRDRRDQNLLTLSEQHRELWKEARDRPELKRIFDPNADVQRQPVTLDEELFLGEVIVNFEKGWQMSRRGGIPKMEVLANDVRDFFSLPVPSAVWNLKKDIQDKKFVEFVERSKAAD